MNNSKLLLRCRKSSSPFGPDESDTKLITRPPDTFPPARSSLSASTLQTSRPVYSPAELLALKSRADQSTQPALPDLPCVSTSPTSHTRNLPALPAPDASSAPATRPAPLFQMARSSKVTIRSPSSTGPSTPISPASPPLSTGVSTPPPLFQAARPSRVSIRMPSSNDFKDSPVAGGGLGQAVRIPGRDAARAVIAPALPASPVQEKKESEAVRSSPDAKTDDSAAGSIASDRPSRDGPSPRGRPAEAAEPDLVPGPADSDSSNAPPPAQPSVMVAYPSPEPDADTTVRLGRDTRDSLPGRIRVAEAAPLAESATTSSPKSSPKVNIPSQKPSPSPQTPRTKQNAKGAIPTPPTSPATPTVSKPTSGSRPAGSTPSGRMVAGALGLKKEKKDGAGGGGGYVRAEVVVERKLTGQELDDKIRRIREENRKIEADYAKEDLDRQSHSPTSKPPLAQQEDRTRVRASAQKKLSEAESEIEKLKRELDRAVQAKIDAERQDARGVKLKALNSGSLDWDASKAQKSETAGRPSSAQAPPKASPTAKKSEAPSGATVVEPPFERPSRPVHPDDVNDPAPEARAGRTSMTSKGGQPSAVSPPKTSVSPVLSGSQS